MNLLKLVRGDTLQLGLSLRPDNAVTDLLYDGLKTSGSVTAFGQLSQIMYFRRWYILGFMLFAVIVAVIAQFVLPNSYGATSVVKVDRHSANGAAGQEASQVSPVDDMDQVMATLIELAQSDPVVRPIAEQHDLLTVEKQTAGLRPVEVNKKRAAPIKLKRLKVNRIQNSYLIRISYRASDPNLAAAVANGIAHSLIEHANDTWNRTYTELSALVAHDMNSLRSQMEESTNTLASYEQRLGMVNPQQRVTVISNRYSQLSTDFTAAQEERLRWEALLSEITGTKSLASAQLAASAVQSSLLTEAITKEEAARQQLASIRALYGENHPKYQTAENQLSEIQTEIAELRDNAVERASAEYQQALERESRLEQVLERTKEEANQLSKAELQYEQLRSEAESDRKLYQDLADRTRVAGLNKQFQNATVQVAAAALPAQAPESPKFLINLLVAFVLSGILGVLGAVIMKATDTTFYCPEEAMRQLEVDILTTIPETTCLPCIAGGSVSPTSNPARMGSRDERFGSYFVESIRALRTGLGLLNMERPLRTVLVTSATPLEGKSTVAAYLAATCAHIGKRILVIDADMRRPTIHTKFGIENRSGLSDVLNCQISLAQAILNLGQSHLSVLTAGTIPHNAADLISMNFAHCIQTAARDFDLIIVDAPPTLEVSETRELSRLVDGVILVTKANATPGKIVSEALASLVRAGATPIGLVMNQVKPAYFIQSHYSYSGVQIATKSRNS